MPRIVRMQDVGGPEVLAIDELEVGQPGPGEVRMKVGAIGLNRTEIMYREGEHGIPELPSKLGYEAAGTIDAVGSGVTDFAVGDRVATIPGLAMDLYGTYGDIILYRADMLVGTPDKQSDLEAAASWMQYLTAYAILAFRPIRRGDPVVITAASSSVGLAAIQITNAEGGVPIAVTRGSGKVDRLIAQGAAHVIVSEEQDVTAEINRLTGNDGAAIVFDAVGGEGFPALLAGLRTGGLAILYGLLGGELALVPAKLMTAANLTIEGYAVNHLLAVPEQRDAALRYITQGLDTGTLHPVVDRVFDLSEIVEAHRYLESGRQLGKIVVAV